MLCPQQPSCSKPQDIFLFICRYQVLSYVSLSLSLCFFVSMVYFCLSYVFVYCLSVSCLPANCLLSVWHSTLSWLPLYFLSVWLLYVNLLPRCILLSVFFLVTACCLPYVVCIYIVDSCLMSVICWCLSVLFLLYVCLHSVECLPAVCLSAISYLLSV